MIRVLHAVGRMHRGGQETLLMNVYRHIDRARVQFDFLVHTEEKCDYDDEIKELGGNIISVRPIRRGILRYLLSIRNVVKRGGYQIVQVHTAHAAGLLVLLAARWGGATSLIAHSHNTCCTSRWLHRLLVPWMARVATVRLACSEAAGRWMYGKADFSVVHNAIDVDAFAFSEEKRQRTRAALGCEGRIVLGQVGRLVKEKNQRMMIETIVELKKIGASVLLMLVGDGEEGETYRQLVRDKQIEGEVLFLGVRNDVPALLSAMDIFVMPSHYEGLSLSAVEAQAAGLPCLISDTVSQECALCERVSFLPIDKGCRPWVNAILFRAVENRSDGREAVRAAGYDMRLEAKRLQHFYEHEAGK